jgi:hypothetical protein
MEYQDKIIAEVQRLSRHHKISKTLAAEVFFTNAKTIWKWCKDRKTQVESSDTEDEQ